MDLAVRKARQVSSPISAKMVYWLLLTIGSWKGTVYLSSGLRIDKKLIVILLGLNTIIASVPGCGKQQVSLQESVKAYWGARVKGDLEGAYSFEAPGAPDKATYLTTLLKSQTVFKSYAIESLEEKGDEAVVQLRMKFLLPGLSRPASSTLLDR